MQRQPSEPSAAALQEHAGFVRALARGLLLGADEVDDVVQETYLTALRRPPRDKRFLRPWMGTVARRAGLKLHRGRQRRSRREQASARPEAQASTVDAVAQLDTQRHLVELVRALDEPYRLAIVMRYFHGLTPTEIADTLRAPVKTVETRLRRARARLREQLDAHTPRPGWRAALAPLAAGASTAPSAMLVGGAATMGLKTKIAAVAALVLCAIGLGIYWSEDAGQATDVPEHVADEDAAPVLLVPDASSERPRPVQVEPRTAVAVSGPKPTSPGTLRAAVVTAGPPAAPPPAGGVVGRVSVEKGLSLPAGVQVRLDGWLARDGQIEVGSKPQTTQTVAADPEGRFAFLDLPHGVYDVTAIAPGYVPARARHFMVTPKRGVRRALVLSRGLGARVVVVDARGKPVSGHGVRLTPSNHRHKVEREVQESDATGVATWALLEAGWYRAAPTRVGAWTPRDLPVVKRAKEKPVVCRIVLGAALQGRVFGPDGDPLAGARLDVADDRIPGDIRRASVITDDDGRYRIAGLPSGEYAARLSKDGFGALAPRIRVASAGETGHDIHLLSTRVSGRLTLESTGKPWRKADAYVSAQGEPTRWLQARLAEDGTWSLFGLPPGRYRLELRPWLSGYFKAARDIEVVAGGTLQVDLALRERLPGTLTLTVTGRKAGDRIALSVSHASENAVTSMGRVGEDGTKTLRLSQGRQTIYVKRNGKQVGEVKIDMPPRGTVHETFELPPEKR